VTIIIGFGFVGQAVYHSLLNKRMDVMIIDPKRNTYTNSIEFRNAITASEMATQPTLIVCVPTPQNPDGSVDLKIFSDVWKDIKNFDGLIIIKSTIPKEFIPAQDNVVYNPEFLNANTANEDFMNQKYVVLGGEMDWTCKAEDWYRNYTVIGRYDDVYYEHCSKDLASDFKYMRNIYSAYKLMFWEFVEDVTGNSRKVSDMMKHIPVREMDIVGMDGFRGFGGACLPKDTNAHHDIHRHKLTEFLLDYNKELQSK